MGQIPAFPGAEGFGAYSTGGRGGDVYTVTSLNNSGAGTLREALDTAPASGRTIVFAVSGYIPVVSDTNFQVPANVTIAGQTAPGDGIGLKGGRMLIKGNNTIMRFFRIRHGKYGTGGDCLNIDYGIDETMIDHVSMMFSTDENFSFFGTAPDNFTMQYSTSTWGMERHNAGGLWDLDHGTCHHSLWAHHRTRNPKARPTMLEWINNVTFHWRNEGFIMGDSETPGDWKANVRGCYYISIDDPDDGSTLHSTGLTKARVSSDGTPNFSLYLDNTLIDHNDNGILDGTDEGYGIVDGSEFTPGDAVGTTHYYKSATPFAGATGLAAVTIDDPLTAYKKVVSSVGPLRLDANYAGPLRDELDSLLIDSVTNQYSILVQKDGWVAGEDPNRTSNGEQLLADQYGISNNGFGTLNSTAYPTDTDGDGMPDYWENALGWNALVQNNNALMPNAGGYLTGTTFFPAATPAGYTQLEEYLHFMAIPHASIAVNSSLDVDLRRYTDGFSASPVFTLANVVNGTAQIQPDGHTLHFTPTTDFIGRSRLEFTVTDADGSSWTQTLALLVSNAFVPPGAPGNLNATPASSFQINLSWTDNADNETGFRIERSTDGVSFNQIAVVAANSTSYSDSGLTPATAYYYRVRAFNDYASSSYSSTASATTIAGPPASPSGLSAASGNTVATLDWTDSPGASGYIIKRAGTSGGPYTSIATNATSGYVDSGLVNLTTYYYVVSALNAYGESANSSEVNVTPGVNIKINAGGPAVSPYTADAYYTGGGSWETSSSIDTSGVVDPAPGTVYKTEHNGNFTYTITGLEPRLKHLIRLHFAEIYHTSAGARVFNVRINGTEVLSNFDIYAETGARYKAMVREFTMPADVNGEITIEFETVVDNAKVSAIEVLNAPEPPASPATLTTVADTHVHYGVEQDNNYGSSAVLYTRQNDTAPRDFMAYVRFDLSSIPDAITDATFKLTKAGGDALVNGRVRVMGLDHVAGNTAQGWSENTITWNTLGSEIDTSIYPSPAAGASPLNFSRVTDFEEGTPGITEAITGNYSALELSGSTLAAWLESRRLDGGQATLIVDFPAGASDKNVSYNSREAGSNPPILTLGFQLAAPSAPAGLSAVEANGRVSLDWNDNGESDFSDYTVYRSTTSGSGYSVVAAGLGTSSCVDSNVTDGTTYYYVVTATDTSYNESDYSTEAEIALLPPNLGSSFSAGTYTVSWPFSKIGWLLQYNTNLTTGAGWQDVLNSDQTNTLSFPVESVSWESIYFRLEKTN